MSKTLQTELENNNTYQQSVSRIGRFLNENLPERIAKRKPLSEKMWIDIDPEGTSIKIQTGGSEQHLKAPCNMPVELILNEKGIVLIKIQFNIECNEKQPEKLLLNRISKDWMLNGHGTSADIIKYSLQFVMREIAENYFGVSAQANIEVYPHEIFQTVLRISVLRTRETFDIEKQPDKVLDFIADICHSKFQFSNLFAFIFKLVANKSLTKLRHNHLNENQYALIESILQIVLILNSIIEEHADNFTSGSDFLVKPHYGPGKYFLENLDEQAPFSIQALIHHIMFEEDIFYAWFLNDQQLEELSELLETTSHDVYRPMEGTEDAELIEQMLNVIYWECIEFVAVKLHTKGFDALPIYAEYLSESTLDRLAMQCR